MDSRSRQRERLEGIGSGVLLDLSIERVRTMRAEFGLIELSGSVEALRHAEMA